MLVNVWLIILWDNDWSVAPLKFAFGVVTVQIYFVPAGTILPLPSVGVTVKAVPPHVTIPLILLTYGVV